MTLIEAAKLAREALTESKEHIAKHKRLEAITSLNQAIAEAEQQEPVKTEFPMKLTCTKCGAVDEGTLIIEEPPKREWQGLSWEEIDECFKITPDQYLPAQIYKRIETKLKQKNHD